MKKFIYLISGLVISGVLFVNLPPRAKFYTHYSIWLPSYCHNFEFIRSPNLMSLFGVDGASAFAQFEIEKENVESFIGSIGPESLWLKYSEADSTLENVSLEYPNELPEDVKNGRIKVMLWSEDTKGDYYNIWLIPTDGRVMQVTISMPFT